MSFNGFQRTAPSYAAVPNNRFWGAGGVPNSGNSAGPGGVDTVGIAAGYVAPPNTTFFQGNVPGQNPRGPYMNVQAGVVAPPYAETTGTDMFNFNTSVKRRSNMFAGALSSHRVQILIPIIPAPKQYEAHYVNYMPLFQRKWDKVTHTDGLKIKTTNCMSPTEFHLHMHKYSHLYRTARDVIDNFSVLGCVNNTHMTEPMVGNQTTEQMNIVNVQIRGEIQSKNLWNAKLSTNDYVGFVLKIQEISRAEFNATKTPGNVTENAFETPDGLSKDAIAQLRAMTLGGENYNRFNRGGIPMIRDDDDEDDGDIVAAARDRPADWRPAPGFMWTLVPMSYPGRTPPDEDLEFTYTAVNLNAKPGEVSTKKVVSKGAWIPYGRVSYCEDHQRDLNMDLVEAAMYDTAASINLPYCTIEMCVTQPYALESLSDY